MAHRFRPWIAAVLALVLAGLGHAYLRRWARALLWLVTVAATSVLLHALHDVDPSSWVSTPGAAPTEILLPLTFLIGLSAVDAFLIGREQTASAENEVQEHISADQGVAGDTSDLRGGDRKSGRSLDMGADVADILPTDERDNEAEPNVEGNVEHRETIQCPHCGKQADATLDFCHWCTEPFPWADEE